MFFKHDTDDSTKFVDITAGDREAMLEVFSKFWSRR